MKTTNDPRHQRRRQAVRQLFAVTFNKDQEIVEFAKNIIDRQDTLDEIITKNAPEWPLDKLNRIDLAILRLAVYELLIDKKEPLKVVIDEAVELAKEMGGDNSPGFINGVLGSIVKENRPGDIEKTNEEETEKNSS